MISLLVVKTTMKFPILFSEQAKTGKLREWRIWVKDNTIYRQDGEVGGKMKDPTTKEIEGNTLRTPEEQAKLEAEKLWIRQLDKGYKPGETDTPGTQIYNHVQSQKAQNGGMNRGVRMFEKTQISTGSTRGAITTKRHYPMLAKKYPERMDSVKFPVWVQPKLDGNRALAHLDPEGNVVLESRNGKSYMFLDHIRRELQSILRPGLVLDGELYAHEIVRNSKKLKSVERYQFFSETCKITRKQPHSEEHLVEYWVFDIWDTQKGYEQRKEQLESLLSKQGVIKNVPTVRANSHSEVDDHLQHYINQDYEGIMIRITGSEYIAKNNYHCDVLLKYKNFEDEEWTVVGAEQCAGSQKGAIKWVLEKNGNRVTAKQMGDVNESRKLWEEYQKNPKKFLGQQVNIRFNDRTKDGVPRFPRAVALVHDK